MRLFTARFYTETNTFAPIPTAWSAFEARGVHDADATLAAPDRFAHSPLAEWRRMAARDGHEIVEGLSAEAAPGGRTTQPVYELLRTRLLSGLAGAQPVDVVLLDLHGAMVAEVTEDTTADLLQGVRDLVGPSAVIGIELDLHCQVTEATLRLADVAICYKEYPHVDIVERAREVYDLACAAATGRLRPVAALFDCRMVGAWPTIREPMSGFVRRMQAAEREPGVLSVSLAHGFPWCDAPAAGARLWVTTDGDAALAAATAERLGRDFYALRAAMIFPSEPIDTALDAALASPAGPWVIADVADNAGGGAPGDSTFILERLLARGVSDAVIGCIADPTAVAICRDAGVGASFPLRLGGKLGPTSGPPLDLPVSVRALADDHAQGLPGARTPMGPSAWVRTGGIDIVIVSQRVQVLDPNVFTGLGIALEGRKLIVVKSSQHFHARFAPLAAEIRYVSSPGALDLDFANIPYRRRQPDFWPRLPDPLSS